MYIIRSLLDAGGSCGFRKRIVIQKFPGCLDSLISLPTIPLICLFQQRLFLPKLPGQRIVISHRIPQCFHETVVIVFSGVIVRKRLPQFRLNLPQLGIRLPALQFPGGASPGQIQIALPVGPQVRQFFLRLRHILVKAPQESVPLPLQIGKLLLFRRGNGIFRPAVRLFYQHCRKGGRSTQSQNAYAGHSQLHRRQHSPKNQQRQSENQQRQAGLFFRPFRLCPLHTLQFRNASALPLGLADPGFLRNAPGEGALQRLKVRLLPFREPTGFSAPQQDIPILPQLFPGSELRFPGHPLREQPVQGFQQPRFFRRKGSLLAAAAHTSLGLQRPGQVLSLFIQFFTGRIAVGILCVQLRKRRFSFQKLPAQLSQILLPRTQGFLLVGLPQLFPQGLLLGVYAVFFPIQGVYAMANRLQRGYILLRLRNIAFQTAALLSQLGDLSTLTLEELQLFAVVLEPLHGRIVIVQIIGVLHQIRELRANGGCGRHIPAGHLGHKGASGKGVCIQLKQVFPQVLRKTGAFRSVRQIIEGKTVLLFSEIPGHPILDALILKFQEAAVLAPLPGVIALALVFRQASCPGLGQAVKHSLDKCRKGAFAETILPAEHIQALRKFLIKAGQHAEVFNMASQELHSPISSPASAWSPARIIAALSLSSSGPARTRRIKAPFRDTSFLY